MCVCFEGNVNHNGKVITGHFAAWIKIEFRFTFFGLVQEWSCGQKFLVIESNRSHYFGFCSVCKNMIDQFQLMFPNLGWLIRGGPSHFVDTDNEGFWGVNRFSCDFKAGALHPNAFQACVS